MSALILKLIACIAMAADHTGYLTGIGWLRLVGRISMPIFVYLVASGYRKTSDPFRYAARLIAFGFISERIYDLCFFGRSYTLAQNVMFTLALGLLAVMFTDTRRKHAGGADFSFQCSSFRGFCLPRAFCCSTMQRFCSASSRLPCPALLLSA